MSVPGSPPTAVTAPRRGIITLAYGKQQFVHMATALGHSLAINAPNIPRAIVTDSHDRRLLAAFDIHIPLNPDFGKDFAQKLRLPQYSPFEQTIFVDSDCLVIRSLDHVWDMFAGLPVGVLANRRAEGPNPFHPDLAALLRRLDRPSIPIFNGGLYYFDNSAAAHDIYARARQIMDTYDDWGLRRLGNRANEEPCLMIPFTQDSLRFPPDDGSVMRHTFHFFGPLHVDVLRQKASFFCRDLDRRVEPAILHLLAPLCEGFHYRRECAKMRLHRMGLPRGVASMAINGLFNPPYAIYAAMVRTWKRWRRGEAPILPPPLWEYRGALPPWQPPWQERELERQRRRALWRRLLMLLVGYRNFQRWEARRARSEGAATSTATGHTNQGTP